MSHETKVEQNDSDNTDELKQNEIQTDFNTTKQLQEIHDLGKLLTKKTSYLLKNIHVYQTQREDNTSNIEPNYEQHYNCDEKDDSIHLGEQVLQESDNQCYISMRALPWICLTILLFFCLTYQMIEKHFYRVSFTNLWESTLILASFFFMGLSIYLVYERFCCEVASLNFCYKLFTNLFNLVRFCFSLLQCFFTYFLYTNVDTTHKPTHKQKMQKVCYHACRCCFQNRRIRCCKSDCCCIKMNDKREKNKNMFVKMEDYIPLNTQKIYCCYGIYDVSLYIKDKDNNDNKRHRKYAVETHENEFYQSGKIVIANIVIVVAYFLVWTWMAHEYFANKSELIYDALCSIYLFGIGVHIYTHSLHENDETSTDYLQDMYKNQINRFIFITCFTFYVMLQELMEPYLAEQQFKSDVKIIQKESSYLFKHLS